MALQLVCLRTLSSAQGSLRGNIMAPCSSSLLNVYGLTNTRDNLSINARYFRISGVRNKTPYDLTPQVRQNSASASLTMSHPLGHVESTQNRLKSITDNNSKTEVLTKKLLIQSLTYLTKTYDFLTLPVYSFIQQPWQRLHEHGKMKAILVDEKHHEWNCVLPPSSIHAELDRFKIDTLEKLFTHAVAKNGNKPCAGHREVISETEELDSQGKVVKKYELGEYQWKTYNEMDDLAEKLSRRFSLFNLKPKDKVAVFAETRAEWLLLAIACFKNNLSIATVFTTLGDSGVVHALNETEVTCLFTSEELMPRCGDILKETPLIKNVVYMDKAKPRNNPNQSTSIPDIDKISNDVKVQTLSSLLSSAESQESQNAQKPEPNDTSIIMYTSGSTGTPKGVILSHWNLVSALKAVSDSLACIGDPNDLDAYVAYLPLAHALELMSECVCFVQGIKIGYSSPLTLTDTSPGIKNCIGDIRLLSPTILAAVPLVLERISKGVQAKLVEKGKIATLLFDYFTKYKMGWIRKGYETPLVDRIFFSKIRSQIGSNLRVVICGGAPLAPQTHELIRTIFCCPVIQGYGLTETCATATMSLGTDLSVGRVGGPISSCRFRLIDWVEGGYKTTDKPFPRGELIIGGENLAVGYFKKSDSTDFFLDEEGNKWFRSGDIVEVESDGVFKVIDRKKDLVKLSTAEFVSLGKIESILKTSPYIENICVFADSFHKYPVAVMVASQIPIEKLAAQLEIPKLSFSQLVKNPLIKEVILSEIQKQARLLDLRNSEIPRKIHLDSTIWLPQSGLVTAALKIKRNNVYQEYKNEIEQMLQEVNAS